MKEYKICRAGNKSIEEKYDKENRQILREIYNFESDEEFEVKLFDVTENEGLKECDHRLSKALNLLLHDMVDKNSPLYKSFHSWFKKGKEEEWEEEWNEYWKEVICRFTIWGPVNVPDSLYLQVYKPDYTLCTCYVPKDEIKKNVNNSDIFTDPLRSIPESNKLAELGFHNIMRYVLAPFYIRVISLMEPEAKGIRAIKNPEDPEVRDLTGYFVSLA